MRHGVDEVSDAADQRLLTACRDDSDDGALLCLRCRVSHPLEQKLLALHRQFSRSHDLDLIALAGYGLEDDGRLLSHNELSHHPASPLSPFTAEVVCTYQPGHGAGLPHWARIKLQAHNGLKAYLRECGVLLISTWALLADTSPRRLREAIQLCGVSGLTLDSALALHAAYCAAYRDAKAEYVQRNGRQSGWLPPESFLRQIAPDQPTTATHQRLLAMDRAIRELLSGQWQRSQSGRAADGNSEDPLDQLPDPGSLASVEEDSWSAAELKGLIDTALDRALEPAVRAALLADQPAWAASPERRRAWLLYGQGLGQREIAEQCDHKQAWVSKLLSEKALSSSIATTAAVELKRHPAFAPLSRSVKGAERLVEVLRNHLLSPEREGDVAPLRCAVAAVLATLAP